VYKRQPLRDGAEVLLSCLNGDPDRPMIVGCLPNPEAPSPVTAANRSHNLYRSAADNALSMDDAADAEIIALRTFAGQNILELNAAALGHRIRLACEQGALHLHAKKGLRVRSGDTLSERSGGDRLQVVENRHRTEARHAEIHHQAATDIRQRAAKTIRLEAAGNVEMTSGRRLRLDIAGSQQVTVKGPEAIFTVSDGHLNIQAARDIRIEGQGRGDISFGQVNGGFVIDAAGNVQIYGKKISLDGSAGVRLNGAVNYVMGAGAPMPAAQASAGLPAHEIAALTDACAPAIYNLAWSRGRAAVGEAVEALFSVKGFRGGEAAIVRIYEWDESGQKDLIDTLNAELEDGTGRCRLLWRRSREQAADDLASDQKAGEAGPLEYRFSVEIAGIGSTEVSTALWLTQTVRVDCRDGDGRALPDGTQVSLSSAGGQTLVAAASGGRAQFPDVVIGPCKITITGQDHRVRS